MATTREKLEKFGTEIIDDVLHHLKTILILLIFILSKKIFDVMAHAVLDEAPKSEPTQSLHVLAARGSSETKEQ